MKKICSLILLLIITFIAGCEFIIVRPNIDPNNSPSSGNSGETKLVIYSINDFHGALFESTKSPGITYIGNYLKSFKDTASDTTIIVSAGDMFQGTAVSSMSRGEIVIDIMNEIGFDAMTIGNHEFDWGRDIIKRYQDGDASNGEANFPLLGANIIYKNTKELVEWVKPYTVIEKSGIKIGIIGLLGSDQTTDILASYVRDLQFSDEYNAIKKYAKILRTTEKCDLVIVSAHLDTKSINNKLSSLSGDEKIDAIINGHTHTNYFGELSYNRDVPLPYIQSGANGQYLGKIVLTVDNKTKEVVEVSAENLSTIKYCTTESKIINLIISKYQDMVDLSNSSLGKSGENINRDLGSRWAANVIRERVNTDIGIVNSGGIRSTGFPIEYNQTVTYGNVFQIMPFENEIKTVYLTGKQIRTFIKSMDNGLYFSDNVTYIDGVYYIDNEALDDNKEYFVSTIDFVFEQDRYPFLDGKNPVSTKILFREALVEDVKNTADTNGTFTTRVK